MCEALQRFLLPAPAAAAERVGAFWGVFPDMLAFLRRVGESPREPPRAPPGFAVGPDLDQVFGSPVGQLCLVLFAAHHRLGEEGGDFDADLLAGLELALKAFDDGGGYCRSRGAALGVMACYAPRLFGIDPVWTQTRLFAHLAAGDAYRQSTARLLLHPKCRSAPPYLAGVRPYVLGFFEDIEAVFGADHDSRNRVLRWLHEFADRAFEEHDEATSAQITDLLRGMPEVDRGNFIGMLRRRFDRALYSYFGPLPDRELFEILSDRLSTPQFIRTFWPAEPQSQTGETTVQFVDLLLNSGEHAEAIFEVCQDFLVPIEDEIDQNLVYSKLADNINYEDFVQANPAIVAGIIDRTTNEHSIHLKELMELKYHLTSETPPAAAP